MQESEPAEKPRRSWLRARNIILVIVLLVLALPAWVAWESWKAAHATANPVHDYRAELRKLSLEAQGGGSEAEGIANWQEVAAAAQMVNDVVWQVELERRATDPGAFEARPQGNLVDFDYVLNADVISASVEWERKALARMAEQGVLDRVEKAADRRLFFHPVQPGPIAVASLGGHRQIQGVARAEAANMRLAFADGKDAEAIASARRMFALARAHSFDGTTIGTLIGVAVDARALQEIQLAAFEHQLELSTCRALLQLIEESRDRASLEFVVELDRWHALDMVQHMYSDNGRGNGYLIPTSNGPVAEAERTPGSMLEGFTARFLLDDRRAAVNATHRVYDEFLRRARLPIHECIRQPGIQSTLPELNTRSAEVVAKQFKAIANCLHHHLVATFTVEGTRLLLAIEAYEAVHGKPPESLDALAPDFLASIPADPLTGSSFGYRLLTDDPEGRHYVLYGYGLDGTDDSGTPNLGQIWGAVQRESPVIGTDFVFNLARRYH